MNNRLKAILSMVEDGVGVIDVGTDHGFIPIALTENNYKGNIYASDINREPLQTAINNAKEAGIADRINFFLCDGLEKCPPEKVDTIVIAGMGGDMICRILDYAEWTMDQRYKLILQPMTKQEVVRYWLSNNGFITESEELAVEGDTIYQIIAARFDGFTKYNDAELFAGKYSLTKSKETYVYQLNKLIDRFNNIIKGLYNSEQAEEYKVSFYSNILNELREMREQYGKG